MAQQEIIDQAQYPWQSVIYITSTFPNGTVTTGSGTMVGPNDVLTASHIVYSSEYGGAATSVTITPAYDPDPLEQPFGNLDAWQWHFFTDYDPDGNGLVSPGDGGPGLGGTELDVALLDLDVPIGLETGWMSLDPTFESGYVNISGYPGLYGNNMMNEIGYVQDDAVDWFDNIDAFDVNPGNSGGPLWYFDNGIPSVVGVVSTTGAAHDIAAVYDTVLDWIGSNDYLIAMA
jgi:V8-like Glu-specific endopeptidase